MGKTPSEINRKYKLSHPWQPCLTSARYRCNKNCKTYKYYGARGIKCLLTLEQVKELWLRDNADSMNIPTIDRIDNDGDYEFNNCRFIEQSLNTIRRNNNHKEAELIEVCPADKERK